MHVIDYYGNEVDFDAATEYMDDGICNQMHNERDWTEQEFFDEYAKRHEEKFANEEFQPYYNGQW